MINTDSKKRENEDDEEEGEEVFGFLKSLNKSNSGSAIKKSSAYSMQANVKEYDEKDVLEVHYITKLLLYSIHVIYFQFIKSYQSYIQLFYTD